MAKTMATTSGAGTPAVGDARQADHVTFVSRAVALPAMLQALRETVPPATGVLSAYIDTSPERSIGRAYLIGFRDRTREIREQLPKTQVAEFDGAVTRAEEILLRAYSPGHPGIAVFAASDEQYAFAAPLLNRPTESVLYGAQPVIAPLAAAVDDLERVVVLLFDKERARIFLVFMGEIEAQLSLFDDVPGKQKTGDWFALSQKRYARHHEDHVRRHAKRVIAALLHELAHHSFDRLLIGGPPEAIAMLEDHLPRRLRTHLSGSLPLELFASDAEVLASVRTALVEIERRDERTAVRALIDSAGSPRVALGPDAVLRALSEGRVHQLLLVDASLGEARECPGCGLLSQSDGPCPRCGAAPGVVADMRELAIRAALNQDARVDIVTGEAAALLASHGGIAARTRWA